MNFNSKNIIEQDTFSYSLYKELTDDFLYKDNRELNYQNRVIIPMLEKIFASNKSINVVDVSTQYKNWEKRTWHDRSKYAGLHTPDILIANNWSIYNRDNNEIEYCMLIEVKKPNDNDRQRALREVNDYLDHVPNVILTDSVTWEFYTKAGEEKDIKYITLEEKEYCAKVCERGISNKTVNWKELEVENPKFIVEEFGFPMKRKEPSTEWEEIIRKLQSIIISQ